MKLLSETGTQPSHLRTHMGLAIVTPEYAEANGYTSLTTPFTKQEDHLLESFLKPLRGSNIILVQYSRGLEVARATKEIKTTDE